MNVAVWKRKVAALKATTGEVAAAAELAKLCEAFPGDAEAVRADVPSTRPRVCLGAGDERLLRCTCAGCAT
ncbi:hypothetical protein EON68_02000 [archaeon]|nr:MAG: hypothetical protein EON68_02000 [archaeon]